MNESFAGYLVEGVLGQGGMGTVYRARHPRLPRLVALKLLHRAVSEDEELRRRFEQEANVVARLDHPGIVSIYDRGDQEGHLWISMQYIPGTDASRLDPRMVPSGHVLQIVTDTAGALDYAHSRGVLHRDIKPANILISAPEAGRQTRAVLTDFGIARLLDSDTKLTATGTFTATLAYASPEQLSAEPVDHRADQYSLACTLFTLLAGRPPYAATNPGQIVAGHLAKPVPRLSNSRPDLPPPLDDVIARAMAKQRDERFASCGEFAAAAAAALRGEPTLPQSRTSPTVQCQPPDAIRHPHSPGDPQPRPTPVVPIQHLSPSRYPDAMVYPRSRSQFADRPRPSGAAAITAAILAALLGLLATMPAYAVAMDLAHPPKDMRAKTPDESLELVLTGGLFAAVALLLLGGSVSLFARKRAGRIAVAVGAGLFVLIALTGIGLSMADDSLIALAALGPVLLVALTTFVCAVSRSTRRWVTHGRSRVRP